MCVKTKEIREYKAVDHVKKDGFTSQTVRKYCKNNDTNKSHKNWVWSFKKEDLEEKYNIAKNGNKNRKDIYKFSLLGEFIEKVDRNLLNKTDLKSILLVCSGKKETLKGFRYSYKKTLKNSKYTKNIFLKYSKEGVFLIFKNCPLSSHSPSSAITRSFLIFKYSANGMIAFFKPPLTIHKSKFSLIN